MALEPAKLADFKLAGALGSGTTAKVYEAVHVATGRPVAIKMLEPSQAGSEMRERFAREAVLLAGVSSRHVARILGFGFDKGQPFLVLERLDGETLDAKLRRDGPIQVGMAVRWIEQLIVGVRDVHDRQIIHRDIKPSNIYLHRENGDEMVKLIDFGVARLKEITGDTTGGLTSTNHLIGSMGYMAPEQFRNAKTVGFSADLYAVGVVVFRTLTGRLPFVSRSLEAVIRMKAEQSAPAISSFPNMPNNVLLDWFVTKSMAREPHERFQNAREMLEHWWNVMGSLDEEAATDVMRGIGRVDESYAGPLRQVARDTTTEDDHTVRRMPRPDVPQIVTPSTAPSTNEEATVLESAPVTLPTPPRDDFDMPTRSDPNLRKLVERELELHRKRKGSS